MDRLMRADMVALIFIVLFSIHGIAARGMIQIEDITEVSKIRYNDVYDCVDFYKQPAFDHPLLANHTFHHEMRPPLIPKMKRSESNHLVNNMEIQYKGKGCPVGTVPIRRLTKNDRIREKSFVKLYGANYNVQNAAYPGTHYAVVRTRPDPLKERKYYGATATLSIWNPAVRSSQYSSSQIVIRNGDNNIQVGWTVNPTLYGNNRTHLFIYTEAGATRCFNTHCPGFVVTNKDIPVDEAFDHVSEIGRQIIDRQFMISMEGSEGHWWLRMGQDLAPVGFWPKNIFTGLANMATNVAWGGQVYSPPNVPSPPMGSGEFKRSAYFTAYCKFVRIFIGTSSDDLIDATNVETYSDSSRYQVKHLGKVGESFGNLVMFGGPGGVTGN